MALFDKIKKASTIASASAAGAGLGATAASAFMNSNNQAEVPDSNVSLSLELEEPNSQTLDPTSSFNPEIGATVFQYPNGNILTEYADGSRSFYDVASGATTAFNSATNETVTYETDAIVTSASAGVADSSFDQTEGGLFNRFREINSEIPDQLKAAGLGIPDQPVQEFRTYQEGSFEDGKVRAGYEARAGWESTYHTNHSGQDEILPGATLNSKATYDAKSFMGASSRGEVGAEWNRDEAHLYVEGRSMVGAEANVDATYKGTLDVEGIKYQPGAEVNGHANAFAGAEAQGRGDLNISSDGASGSLGGEAFAGAKAEVNTSGALSIDGNDFARGEGGADVRAGIGAEFNVDAGYQDGQIQYGLDMGAALGVGAGYQYSGSVDAPGILTHPDAVWESAVKEVNSYMPEVPTFSVDPNTYANQAEQYVKQQIQEHVPIAEEVSQVVETASDIGNALEDFGSSFGL